MSRAAFRQADIERIVRAAERTDAIVQIDIRSLVVTLIPGAGMKKPVDQTQGHKPILSVGDLAPDGKENWDEN